jgi:DNA polymerase I-like protein with 3'-5' exonuclease and polymerase domains
MGKEWSEYFSWVGKLERNALNYRIQGLSGSMTKYAAVLFREHQLKTNNSNNYYLINLVHDEILAEANPGYEEETSEIIKSCMEKAGAIMCQRVKMGAVPVISKVWEH